ncbi:hypothetical protein LCGC14_1156400 [marine sediment metagenome]|uniref:Uncharacterized protein n=1 Tax=marine sediment metagenome TaxID=412755 RepID=A0A0F9PZE9_9ZZZZ
MTPREKLLDRIQKLDAQLAKFTAAMEVFDELGVLEATPIAAAPAKEEERNPATHRPPPQRPAPAQPPTEPPPQTPIPPGGCVGRWDGAHPSCLECQDAARCRAATPQA